MEERKDVGAADRILGQKWAFAAASLVLGVASYISLLGMEKAILAIGFGVMALRASPQPKLSGGRRNWARVGIALGVLMLVAVPVLLLIFQDRVVDLIEALERLQ